MTKTLSRQSGCVSLAKAPSEAGDEDPPQLFAIAGAHLHNARIVGARSTVGAQDQLEARGEIQVESAERHGIEISRRAFR